MVGAALAGGAVRAVRAVAPGAGRVFVLRDGEVGAVGEGLANEGRVVDDDDADGAGAGCGG